MNPALILLVALAAGLWIYVIGREIAWRITRPRHPAAIGFWENLRWKIKGGQPKTKQEALANIRTHYTALGIPHGHLNDEELEASVTEFCVVMHTVWSKTAITAAQLSGALQQMASTGTMANQALQSLGETPRPHRS